MTDFPDTRATLLAAVQSPQDLQAWDEFVTIYRPVIYRMARRRGMQDADAQDVTQDILVRVSGAIERYRPTPGIRFRNWLGRVAKNTILNALSSPCRDNARGGSEAHDELTVQAQPDSAQNELEKEYQRELYLCAARDVRSEVSEPTWQAFELTVVRGMTCQQAADSIGKSIGTVYAARSRIVKRLREKIESKERAES